jgi:hypothetical protein
MDQTAALPCLGSFASSGTNIVWHARTSAQLRGNEAGGKASKQTYLDTALAVLPILVPEGGEPAFLRCEALVFL